ncbi:MAG: hypothetical protein HYZ28_13585 [Myxococcales bacterium]|nr:hypothetical protein [Myxococcales bacterium]
MAYRWGPFPKLGSADFTGAFLNAFGYTRYTGEQRDLVSTEAFPPSRHAELWQHFADYDPQMQPAVDKMKALFKERTLYAITVDTPEAFGGKVYLMAQMPDGSLVGLKDRIAGMNL